MFRYTDPNSGRESPFGKINVAAFSSPYHVDGFAHPGAIWLYGLPLSRVVDGASDTLVLGEIRTRDHDHDQRGAWALPWSGASLISVDMHPEFMNRKSETPGAGAGYRYSTASLGFTQRPNSMHPDVLYECPDLVGEQLDAMPCTTDEDLWRYISAAPRSHHPEGANVAYLDGHTAFLSNDVDEIVMAYQASVDDEHFHKP
jgi:prepilin-type processing-associated H-X9-DG protein